MIIFKPKELGFCQEFMFAYMEDLFLTREYTYPSLYKFYLEPKQTAKLNNIHPLNLNNERVFQKQPSDEWGYSVLFLTKRKSHNCSVAYFP